MATRIGLTHAVWLLWMPLSGIAWAHDVVPPPWRGQDGTTFQEWQYGTNANPAVPDTQDNPYGSPIAQITVGRYGSGWLGQIPGFGTQFGYWDLGGTNGRILIDLPNPSPPPGTRRYGCR